MDTFRDSAVGKLIRLFTRFRVLQYPEEADPAYFKVFLKPSKTVEAEEKQQQEANDDVLGLWTVMSQVSRATRTQTTRTASSTAEQTLKKEKTVQAPAMVIDWVDENDPENPQNWSSIKKWSVSSLIWLLTFAVYIGSAIYTPGIPGVSQRYGVSSVAATIGLTVFVGGYGLGPMLWAPLSELPPIGRSPVYIFTLIVFVFFNFGVIYADNFGMLLAFRFLTGFFGSPVLATGAGSMADIWSPRTRDYMIGIWGSCAVAAPVLGPLIGGFAFSAYGWTWCIWPLVWVSGFTLCMMLVLLPETYAPNILYRRARRVKRVTGDQTYVCESEIEVANLNKKDVLFEAIVRPFSLMFGEPIVLLMDLYISLIYGILYIWFEAFPIVFAEKHGFNPGETGLAFLGILVGTAIAVTGYFLWKWKRQSKHFDTAGNIKPEEQLPPSIVGAFCLCGSLFWFGWSGNSASVHWIVPILASVIFAIGGCLIFNCIFNYQAHAYPKYAASVLAGNDFMRSSFGAGFPLFASAMFHNLGVGWACTLLGCLCAVFIPYPFILYRHGERLRMKSKFARHDV